MLNQSSNNKRIAKNTLFLYARMLITLVVQLYTSRVILDILGASDYGIYNVVGGVVTMFAFLSGTMATATQRFMTYAIGKNDIKDLRETFVTSNMILWGIAIVVIFLVESIGLWMLFEKLNIPVDRLDAAFWVFQLSVVSLFINIISVPYNAAIIAHQKMSVFAGFGLIDIFLRLVIVLMLGTISSYDRLIIYSAAIVILSLMLRIFYAIYCNRHFEECSNNTMKYNKEKGKLMLSFFGWNTIGAFSYVTKEQGINILINIFFGTIINAARGITAQVTGAVQGFITNFQLAMNPQITTYYAQKDYDNLFSLVKNGAKFSLFLYFVLALPLFLDLDYILNLWLVNVPDHTASFVRLTFILMMTEALSSPVITCLLAIGKVKWYQIIVGGLLILNLPISYCALKLGYAPEITIQIAIMISIISLLVRLYLLNMYIKFPSKEFILNVVIRSLLVVVISYFLSSLIYENIHLNGIPKLIITCLESWLISVVMIFYFGMNKDERKIILNLVNKYINKIKRK